jgi:lipoate-protein ligase A
MAGICHAVNRLCRTFGVEAASELAVEQPRRISICLAEPSPYAIVASGRKLAGLALRRYPASWLVQGSLLVRPAPEALWQWLSEEVKAQLRSYAVSLAEASGESLDESEVAWRFAEQFRCQALVPDTG